ncbi:GGDEF domain-containing protein, partial [Vibrio sp. M260118]|uniref:GGDEF domain-containing protein n=1 Tax=Vibrio sp. M260118 TaxID=3020896 RepID=UPI002F3EBE24
HSFTYSELNQKALLNSLPTWGAWLIVYALILTAYFNHRVAVKNHNLMIKDVLTGILNRRGLALELDDALEQLESVGRNYAVMIADIDFFKRVNDEFGHDIGDVVIRTTAKRIQASLREDSILSRWGGEEFLVVVPNVEQSTAEQIAERLRANIEATSFPQIDKVVTISIGVTIESKAKAFNDAIKRADAALYQAKEGGRNQVRFIEKQSRMAEKKQKPSSIA